MNVIDAAEDRLRAGRPGDVPEMFLALQANGQPGFGLYWEFLRKQFSEGKAETLEALHEATATDSPMGAASHYFLAALAVRNGDIDACKAHLHQTRTLMLLHRALLLRDDATRRVLQGIANQESCIEPSLDLSGGAATAVSAPGDPFIDPAHDFFVLASCNGIYFDRFATAFAEALFGSLPDACCHIRVINPVPDSALLDSLPARFARLRLSVEEGPEEATYHACRRFQVAAGLMRHYRLSALVCDIDMALSPAVGAFDGLGQRVAGGVFKQTGADPMLFMPLGLSYFAYRPETLSYLDCLDRYLEAMLPRGYTWMLDQCAILTVTLLAESGRLPLPGDFALADLAPALGHPLDDVIIGQDSTTAEKRELRGQ